MNFERQAKRLEQFLEEELKTRPLALEKNGNIIYKNFIIKKNKQDKWSIRRFGGYNLDSFYLKTCALTAAKLYGLNDFKKYNELKILDDVYFKNSTDAEIYKHRYQKSNDQSLKDMFIARYTESKIKAGYARTQILSKFKVLF